MWGLVTCGLASPGTLPSMPLLVALKVMQQLPPGLDWEAGIAASWPDPGWVMGRSLEPEECTGPSRAGLALPGECRGGRPVRVLPSSQDTDDHFFSHTFVF